MSAAASGGSTFWTQPTIKKYLDYANMQRQYSTIMGSPNSKNNTLDQSQIEKQRKIQTIDKYEEIRQNLQNEVDKEFQASKYKTDADEKITFE